MEKINYHWPTVLKGVLALEFAILCFTIGGYL